MKGKWNIILPAVIMLIFAVTRWPGLSPVNFSAGYALSFCAGVYFPGVWKWILPMGTMLVTDIILNVFYYHVGALNVFMVTNYMVFAVLILLGRQWSSKSSWVSLLFGGLLGSLIFYVVTNTASWFTAPEYTKNFGGWIQSLTVGLPGYPPTWTFFKNTLLSGGLFTGLFAGSMKLGEVLEKREQEEKEEVPDESEEPEKAEA